MKFLVKALPLSDLEDARTIGEIEIDPNSNISIETCLDILAAKNLLKEIETDIKKAVKASPEESEDSSENVDENDYLAAKLAGRALPRLPIDWQSCGLSFGEWAMWRDGMETRPFKPLFLSVPVGGGRLATLLEIRPKAETMLPRARA